MTHIAEGAIVDNRFVLRKAIGAGGMGSVFEASQTDFDRIVAIKFMAESLATDPEPFARFQREAQVLSQLHHKNIVSVYAFGIWNRSPYMVMERVFGKSLQEMLRPNQPLSSDFVLNIALQACDGMESAHAMGIIHRDLKPTNLIVNETGELKIIDFGLAKLLQPSGNQQQLTEAGTAVGSVLYMSPEQCLGRSIDSRADLYALGCVLHHCLAGTPPFPGDHSVVVMMQHTANIAPRIANISENWQNFLDNAMAKDPNIRYQNADEMRRDLNKIARGESVPRLAGALQTSAPNHEPLDAKQPKRSAFKIGVLISVGVASVLTVALLLPRHFESPQIFRDITHLDALAQQASNEEDPAKRIELSETAAFAFAAAAPQDPDHGQRFWRQAQSFADEVYRRTPVRDKITALKRLRPCFGGDGAESRYSLAIQDAAHDTISYATSGKDSALARSNCLMLLDLAQSQKFSGYYWDTILKVCRALLNIDVLIVDKALVQSDADRILTTIAKAPMDSTTALGDFTGIADGLHENQCNDQACVVFGKYLGPRIEHGGRLIETNRGACADFLQNLLISEHQLNHPEVVDHYVPIFFSLLHGLSDREQDFVGHKLAFAVCFPNRKANEEGWKFIKALQANSDERSKQTVALFQLDYALSIMQGHKPDKAYTLIPNLANLGPGFQVKEYNCRCRVLIELNRKEEAQAWLNKAMQLIATNEDELQYRDRFITNIMAADLADAHGDKKAVAKYLAEAKRLATSENQSIDAVPSIDLLNKKYKEHGIDPNF